MIEHEEGCRKEIADEAEIRSSHHTIVSKDASYHSKSSRACGFFLGAVKYIVFREQNDDCNELQQIECVEKVESLVPLISSVPFFGSRSDGPSVPLREL